MDERYRNIFARHLLSIRELSECEIPKSAIIVRDSIQVGSGFSKKTNTEFDTSPIYDAMRHYYIIRDIVYNQPALFCSYFPNLGEFLALYSSDIRTVYYMGDITDEAAVRFLNNCLEPFEIIKLEVQ